MKKLFILLIGLVFFTSCCSVSENDIGKAKVITTDKLINMVLDDGTPYSYMRVTEFEYNGHKYISFDNERSVIHNPDCECLIKMRKHAEQNSNSYYSSYSSSSIWD